MVCTCSAACIEAANSLSTDNPQLEIFPLFLLVSTTPNKNLAKTASESLQKGKDSETQHKQKESHLHLFIIIHSL